jgi:hypothetical protein
MTEGVRLHFVVEGQTEETFVNLVLKHHLALFSVWVDVRSVEVSRRTMYESGREHQVIYRGGIRSYARLKKDLQNWMRQEANNDDAWFTTMVDFYGINHLTDDFPGFRENMNIPEPHAKIEAIEQAFLENIGHRRFVPYLQLHEYEALLFSDILKLKEHFYDSTKEINQLVELADSFKSPELINDGQETAPSKRIISLIPAYSGSKTSAGPNTAIRIGLQKMREKCTHFNRWISKLEKLGEVKNGYEQRV